MKLTQEQKRIKIAEACGWKRKGKLKLWDSPIPGGGWEYLNGLPDYFNDLNACHEMEKRMRRPTGDESDSLCADRMIDYAERLNYEIDATAACRAEAFGVTMELWEEEE